MTTTATAPARPSPYVLLLRAHSFPASLVPLLVGVALAVADPGPETWWLLPVVLLGGVGLHVVANVANDLFDHEREVDVDYPLNGSSGVLVDGTLTPAQVRRFLYAVVGLVVACGAVALAVRGLPLLVLGVVGLLGAYGYTGGPKGYKYLALGDLMVLLLMGPLMVAGAYLCLAGSLPAHVLLAGLPVGFVVSAIIVANNLRDVVHDEHTRTVTVSTLLAGRPALAEGEYVALLAAAYLSVPVLVLSGVLAWPALLVLLTLPLARPLVALLRASRFGVPEDLGLAFVVGTAKLHSAFGAALAVGLVLGRFV